MTILMLAILAACDELAGTASPAPRAVPDLFAATTLAFDDEYACAARPDGTVRCLGSPPFSLVPVEVASSDR